MSRPLRGQEKSTHPFRPIREGVSVLTPGATLYVKRETYFEDLINTIAFTIAV